MGGALNITKGPSTKDLAIDPRPWRKSNGCNFIEVMDEMTKTVFPSGFCLKLHGISVQFKCESWTATLFSFDNEDCSGLGTSSGQAWTAPSGKQMKLTDSECAARECMFEVNDVFSTVMVHCRSYQTSEGTDEYLQIGMQKATFAKKDECLASPSPRVCAESGTRKITISDAG